MLLSGCASLPSLQRDAEFEQLTRLVEMHYYDAGFAGVNWPELKQRYRAQIEDVRTPAQLDRVMNRMLSELGRSHLKVVGPSGAVSLRASAQTSVQASPPLSAAIETNAPKPSLKPIRLERFTLQDATAFCADLRKARHQDMVVIDLRANPGGQVAVLQSLLGLFIDVPQRVGQLRWRREAQPLLVKPQAFQYLGRVAVLVDDRSQSMAEIFAYALQQGGRAQVLGQRTAGQVLVSRAYPLARGRTLQIPVADFLDVYGHSLEGRGVRPDLPLNRDDPVALEQVLASLRTPLLAPRPRPESVGENAASEPLTPLPVEAHQLIQKLGASMMPGQNRRSRLIRGRVIKRQGEAVYAGQFWLAQQADGVWTMGERLAEPDAVEYRYGRDQEGYWMQHSTTGYQRRPASERALFPVIPLMPIHAAAEARENFAPSLRFAGIAEKPEGGIGHLVEQIDGRQQKIQIDARSGALLLRGQARYFDYFSQDGALLPRRVETADAMAPTAGEDVSADTMNSVYLVDSVSHGEPIPADQIGPQANCFTTP